ncbi:hypothetical protein ACFVUN_30545 [Kitasatospora griseola]|uniref:hypothetical protein n=1 Tax=Kitasatospora griseola TaxID=2064 RepID=UPI0036DE9748
MTDALPPTILLIQAAAGRPVALDEEHRQISMALNRSTYGDIFGIRTLQAARARDLPDQLAREVPMVMHFSGRGTPNSGLRFVTDDGSEAPTSISALCKLLAEYTVDGLGLVVLNACWTVDLAEALSEAVGCVIGTSGPIPDQDAISYSYALYRNLGCGHSVGQSHRRACAEVELLGADERYLPELFAGPGIDADTVFLVDAGSRTPLPQRPHKPHDSNSAARLRKPVVGRPARGAAPRWDLPGW